MRVIKRYPNRKLYDTTARQYVTLQAIRHLVGKGEKVQVVDSRTGRDVTKGALSKIVLEAETEIGGNLPTSFFTDIIKRGSRTVSGYLKKTWEAGRGAAQWAEEELENSVAGLVNRGKLTLGEADDLKKDFLGRVRSHLAAQESNLQAVINTGIERALHTVNLPTRNEVDQVRSRLTDVETRINRILNGGKKTALRPTPRPVRKKA